MKREEQETRQSVRLALRLLNNALEWLTTATDASPMCVTQVRDARDELQLIVEEPAVGDKLTKS